MSANGFNTIPGNTIAPIITFEINSGGNFSNESRGLIIAHKSSVAKMADNVALFAASRKEARKLAGKSSMLYDMYRRMNRAGAQDMWMMSAEDSGVAQVRTITFPSVPASGGVGIIEVAGERLQITLGAGDTVTDAATALAAAVNSFYDQLTEADLPYSATSAGGVVTLTAAHRGAIFEGVDIWVDDTVENAFQGATLATTTAGSGDPDLSAALAAINENNWDWIFVPFSDDANFSRYEDLLSDVSGRWAWNKQLYGHVFTAKRGTTAQLTTYGDAKDTRHVSTLWSFTGSGDGTPIWGVLAEQMGRLRNWLSDGTNGGVTRGHEGLIAEGQIAPRDVSTWPQYDTRNTFLQMGLSTWRINGASKVELDKVVTHHQTESGAPDTVFRDIQSIAQLTYGLRKIRADLAFNHSNQIAADDDTLNENLPVSTVQDVDGTLVHSYTELVEQGVFRGARAFGEASSVVRDPDNPNRYSVFAPILRGVPLDVIASNATIYTDQIPSR